jgi:putative flippase GtrA
MEATLQLTIRRFGRPLRFGLVGISGIVVNSAILWGLVHGPRLAIPLASAIATEAAILSNFLLNDRWTFRAGARADSAARRLLRFNGVALGGMLITALILTALTTSTRLPLLIANVLAVGAATIWNYAINSRWTWSNQSAVGSTQPAAQIAPALVADKRDRARTSFLRAANCFLPPNLEGMGLLWSGDGRLLTEQDEDTLL